LLPKQPPLLINSIATLSKTRNTENVTHTKESMNLDSQTQHKHKYLIFFLYMLATPTKVTDAGYDINVLMQSTAFEERQKAEILREYSLFNQIKYAYWINPIGKSGRRIKPVEFNQLHVSIEVPRPYISSKIILTGCWMDTDFTP